MPEYLAPGVFVEEVSFRSKSIQGVGTSIASIVGPTRTGPLRGRPELLTSFADYVRVYGSADDLSLGGSDQLNHTAIAARAFFQGGGTKLYVSRVVAGVNSTDADGAGSTASFASQTDTNNDVTFSSRFPGSQGNLTLELSWRDSENLLKLETTSAPDEGEVVFLEASGLTTDVRATGISARVPIGRFPMSIRALVRREGANYVIVDNRCEITADDATVMTGTDLRPDGATEGDEGILVAAGLVNSVDTSVTFTRVYAKNPTSGALSDGTSSVLTLSGETDLSTFTGGDHWGTITTLRGTINGDGDEFTLDGGGLNAGVLSDLTFPLAALAAEPSSAAGMMVQRNFDLDVRTGGANGEVIYSYANISSAPDATNSLPSVLASSPAKKADALASPVSASLDAAATGDEIIAALYDMFDSDALSPAPGSVEGPRYLITLAGGDDGDAPVAVDYGGEVDEVNGSTGFAALADIEDIAIVMAPAASADATNHQAIVAEMQSHCRQMRYRVGIVDSREGMSLSEVRDFRSNFDDSRLALYYPWVTIADPTGQRTTINVPPAGFIAGVYANTDVQRGVHKAPANEPVVGALGFAQDINRFQQELLNPEGINCLRSFPGRGHRVWGGRTLSSDPEWKYLNIRRFFLYLERSIEKSTQWVVFEPNGERLWDNVRSTVEDFLYNEWFNGRLLGPTPKHAYFVRCDRSTMTQNDLDNGRLVCEIGVAPLAPAEFVIFRIGQKTADA
ncbi:phage tail protein [Aliikangiella marina]|uniref:Phage tail protein n=1 Tax=Aliikangiella marina TaxID=1712262 RepID=A0A545T2P8_9GAMM|nr:phage tail sheath subtilisin-like domain-containing protein [Aliikangiella marina]TQV71497.1 phage tail protein [Aliikangiella marina]